MTAIKAEFLSWTPLLNGKKGFPRDRRGNPYIPGRFLIQAVQSSIIFYYTGKDKFVEKRIRRYLTGGFRAAKVVPDMLNIVIDRYDVLTGFWVPDRIYIPSENVRTVTAVVYDIEKDEEVEAIDVEAFIGTTTFKINMKAPEKIKAAAHSFSESLARIERDFVEEIEPLKKFYDEYINELKKQQIPLRMGWWTDNRYDGSLLFFWKIKEVRDEIIKKFGIDILPRRIIYVVSENAPAGWGEIKITPENEGA